MQVNSTNSDFKEVSTQNPSTEAKKHKGRNWSLIEVPKNIVKSTAHRTLDAIKALASNIQNISVKILHGTFNLGLDCLEGAINLPARIFCFFVDEEDDEPYGQYSLIETTEKSYELGNVSLSNKSEKKPLNPLNMERLEKGYGMENNKDSCFMIASFQALKKSPFFRSALKKELTIQEVIKNTFETEEELEFRKELQRCIREAIDTSDSERVGIEKITHLRQLFTKPGISGLSLEADDQQDISELMMHMLPNLEIQPYSFLYEHVYTGGSKKDFIERKIPRKQYDIQDSASMELPVRDVRDPTKKTPIKGALSDIILRQRDTPISPVDGRDRDNNYFDENNIPQGEVSLSLPIFESNTNIEGISTDNFPQFIPIVLKRLVYENFQLKKYKNPIPLEGYIDIPIKMVTLRNEEEIKLNVNARKRVNEVVATKKAARYKLLSVGVHSGGACSGHYYTYAKEKVSVQADAAEPKEEEAWVMYNDSYAGTVNQKDAIKDMTKNGLLYILGFDKIIDVE